jgi:hypothetical protein
MALELSWNRDQWRKKTIVKSPEILASRNESVQLFWGYSWNSAFDKNVPGVSHPITQICI